MKILKITTDIRFHENETGDIPVIIRVRLLGFTIAKRTVYIYRLSSADLQNHVNRYNDYQTINNSHFSANDPETESADKLFNDFIARTGRNKKRKTESADKLFNDFIARTGSTR